MQDLVQPETVYQLLHPSLPADFPPLGSPGSYGHNLPLQLTSFIGREQEIAEVRRLLGANRFLTLIGAGGCGKTRLALEVAAGLLRNYPDGIWLAELAPVADPAVVPQTIASVLGVRPRPGQPILSALVGSLQPRKLLLVLDNCEHLAAACASLAATLLQSCPGLHLLATSREVLGIQGETLYRVPSLLLPDIDRLPPLEQVARYDSVRLFVERARSVVPAFTVTERTASTVAQICCRLDGMPLAIELAAARVRVLSVEQIVQRLDDRFRLLVGHRGVVPRHQTLRATIDWSFGLLTEAERSLLRRLAVFAGGWSLEASEKVCSGDGVPEQEVLDLLGQLVDKSLVLVEERASEARYRVLETIRQYAWERLAEAGEMEVMRARHRDWFLALAVQAGPALLGEAHIKWIERLEMEHGNLRAALEYCVDNDPEGGARLGGSIWRFWRERGYSAEGHRWLDAILARTSARTSARGWALKALGTLIYTEEGDYEGSIPVLEASLELFRETGDEPGLIEVLHNLGMPYLTFRGDRERSRQMFQECLDIARKVGDLGGQSRGLAFLGRLAGNQGDLRQAKRLMSEATPLVRKTGEPWSIASILFDLGWLAILEGDFDAARERYEEMRRLGQEIGDGHHHGLACLGLAMAALSAGERAEARALLVESLGLLRERHSPGIGDTLSEFGRLAILEGRYATGVRLVAAGASQPGTWHIFVYKEPADARREKILFPARAALGEEAFQSAWAEGEAMSLEEAVDEALAVEPSPATSERFPATQQEPLTARQCEVASLVAEGLTNAEIAERLVISPRTAETHVNNILNKLGFCSRAQIASWAAKRGVDAESHSRRGR